MDADKTRSDAPKRSDTSALEQEVMGVLLDPSERQRLRELAAELRARRAGAK